MEGVKKGAKTMLDPSQIQKLKRFFKHIADVNGNPSKLEILDDDNS